MQLFQIEEPQGGPANPSLPAAAIGVDLSGGVAEAAFAVGGNAVLLQDRAEFSRVLPVPGTSAAAEWRALFEGVRVRAERLLARHVTHAVVVLGSPPADTALLRTAAAEAGLEILRLASAAELPAGAPPALAAAILAEDLMPRPRSGSPTAAYFL